AHVFKVAGLAFNSQAKRESPADFTAGTKVRADAYGLAHAGKALEVARWGRAAAEQNIPVIPALQPTSLTIRQAPSPLLPSACRPLASRLVPHWSFGRARAVPSTVAPR